MNKKISLFIICLPIFLLCPKVKFVSANGLGNSALSIDTLFVDDFNGGNLAKWQNVADWTVGNEPDFRLEHNLTDTSAVSYITAKYNDCSFDLGTTTWKFRLQTGNFTPSSSNKFGYFLMSDNDTLKSSTLSGYAIGVCMNGSSKDLVMLRYDAGKKTTIFTTSLVWAEANTSVDFEIKRQPKGIWSIGYRPDTVGAEFVYTDEFTDNKYNKLAYHGFYFSFSKTRAGMFYADNVCVSRKRAPISIVSATCTDANTIVVEFSGNLDSGTAVNVSNYAIPGIDIEKIIFDNAEPQKVTISAKRFNGGDYTLAVSGLKSAEGVEISDLQVGFTFIPPAEPYWLVFNELMFDPSPVVGLPNYDYIEIFNNGPRDISLGGWTLDISGTIRQFPDSIIKMGEYLIVTSNTAVDSFNVYGKSVSVITTTNLTNTGKTLLLVSPEGVVIDSLTYTETSIPDEVKGDGGWALERIDPNNTCGGWQNWAYSVNNIGGTPGKKNSVFASNIDNKPVSVVGFRPFSSSQLLVQLSEIPTIETLSDLTNYTVKSIGNPIGYELNGTDLTLSFRREFESDKDFTLVVANLTDPCGNVMNDTTLSFLFHNTDLYELVIDEIMATPEPSAGLPEYEWVEIYNRSNFDIFLNGYSLGVGNKKYTVESGFIEAGGYALLAKSTIADSLSVYGNVVKVSKMPTLSQSGTLTIFNQDNEPICSTTYKTNWYADDLKASGGYSLERIDFDNPDETTANWVQTESLVGGTPCAQNSVYKENADTVAPNLLYVVPASESTLLLVFSEPVDIDADNIGIEPNIGSVSSVTISGSTLSTVIATLDQNIAEGVAYTLTVDSTVTDVVGNVIADRQSVFGLPENAQVGDVVINEILFNPFAGGCDFVELYNRSERAINIDNFLIANNVEGNIKNPKRIDAPGFILMPHDYVAIATDIDNIATNYKCGNLYKVSALPAMADDEGSAVLLDTLGNVFDEVFYSSKMHFALLKELNGVSLERIDFDQPSDNSGNWHSASEYVGWATPGLQNSAYKPIETESDQSISLDSEVFSPDNDGFEDQLEIAYNFEEAGYVANVTIFNAKGLKMRTLTNNEMLGTSGFWAWDGLDDNNKRVPTGIYVIYCEVFNLEGNVTKVKKVCVVSTKM